MRKAMLFSCEVLASLMLVEQPGFCSGHREDSGCFQTYVCRFSKYAERQTGE